MERPDQQTDFGGDGAKTDRTRLTTLEQDQLSLTRWVRSSPRFTARQKSAIENASVAEFNEYWSTVNNEAKHFEDGHRHGCGLWARKYQNTTTRAQDFMKGFSPVLDAVQEITTPYGGPIVIGVISFLFAVSKNKTRTEALITSTLAQIKDRLPGINLRKHIHNNSKDDLHAQVQQKIIDTYKAFVEFSIESIKYYQSRGHARWLEAVFPSTNLQEKSDAVQAVAVEMRQICELLLERDLGDVKHDLGVVKQDLQDSMVVQREQMLVNGEQLKEIQALRESHFSHQLREIQTLLGRSQFSFQKHWADFDEYCSSLSEDQDGQYLLEQSRDTGKLDSWLQGRSPSMLVILGHNDESRDWSRHCWASPLAAERIGSLRASRDDTPFAFFVIRNETVRLPDVVTALLAQLLHTRQGARRDEQQWAELVARAEKLREAPGPSQTDRQIRNKRIKNLEDVAVHVIRMFGTSETVEIIVDRLDRCRVREDGPVGDRGALLKLLSELVKKAHARVKILVVVNWHDWKVDEWIAEEDLEREGRMVLEVREQRPLGW